MREHTRPTMILVSLMIFVFWLVFLFLDGAFSSRSFIQNSVSSDSLEEMLFFEHNDENLILSPHLSSSQPNEDILSEQLISNPMDSGFSDDLKTLEYLYIQHKNSDLLQPMIEKFLQYYQFEKANAYLTVLLAEQGSYVNINIDPHKVVYIRFHDFGLNLDSDRALDDILSLVATYRSESLMSYDDELFYKGLQSLWLNNYDVATETFSKIVDSRYKDFILAYESALATYLTIKNPPTYYRDGLVALTLFKHGYFSLSKRIALRAIKQNSTYILPYQVLAYTNFLTHNRESAKQYFLLLSQKDPSKSDIYTFFIGVAYYWIGDYDQSILYLHQVHVPAIQTDVYRYMLLNYIYREDSTNSIRMFTNLLGQSDLQSSDFVLFFDHMFYTPFRLGKSFDLYHESPQLVELYLSKCSMLFGDSQADICVYGEVGLQLVKQNLSSIGTKILALSQVYQQSHLYHVLGDYYVELGQHSLAREAYAQALSISDSLVEQKLIKEKMEK